jgi:hypothetical protein
MRAYIAILAAVMTLHAAAAQRGQYDPTNSKYLAEQNGESQKGVVEPRRVDANGNAAQAVPK